MAKLKCETHNRRVVVIKDRVIHRTGDGSKCLSEWVHIGDTKIKPSLVGVYNIPRTTEQFDD